MTRMFVFLAVAHLALCAHGRTWTEATSGRKLEADYVSSNAERVTVRSGTRTLQIELSKLSAEDQAFVRQQLEVGKKPAAAQARVEDRFEDISGLKVANIPVNGKAHAGLAPVEEAIRAFMAAKGVGAVTFALSRDGEILHDRAFGWADADLKTPLQPGVKMRLASMTKPVVKAAILTLFAEGKLKADDLIFPLLELNQYPEAKNCDERWQKITIQHLLDHKGGWDRDKSGDFTFRSDVAEVMKVKLDQLTPEHIVRYGLLQKFDFEPGERSAYCNYGYILLVRALERTSGMKFVDYLQATVCKQAKSPSFSLSASDAEDRQPGEVWYCYHPEYPKKQVPLPFRTEARDGAGVLACTAADYCRFLEAYWISGTPRKGGRAQYAFSGSHAGVTAISSQRQDGINYAIICNRRGLGRADWNAELRKAVDAALDPIAAEVK